MAKAQHWKKWLAGEEALPEPCRQKKLLKEQLN
jgi:hypothetical protein